MKTLILDIECTPHTVHRWGMYDTNPVYPNQLVEPGRLLCFAAKWKGGNTTFFYGNQYSHEDMVKWAHRLLSEADVVITYNGSRHDIPYLDGEFVLYGMAPPAPYVHVDLFKTVRKLKLPFKSLDYITKKLGLGGKADTGGHELWMRCMAGDKKAWLKMARYNRQDVVLTEKLYDALQPWVVGQPNARLTGLPGSPGTLCPVCGKGELRREGYALLSTGKYQRYQCRDCGAWSRDVRRVDGTDIKAVS